eukprot:4635825-Pleurochrysis_carterae.AAC.2
MSRQTTTMEGFLSFGEAMLRFSPLDDENEQVQSRSTTRHEPTKFLRTVGGDELNSAVAFGLLRIPSKWVSVVPAGPLGDAVVESCKAHNVQFDGPRVEGEDLGIYTMLPEEQTVHYQRKHSAFATHSPDDLNWASLMKMDGGADPSWLQMTGITPLISTAACESWKRALEHAKKNGIKASLDLNHRAQLGTLAELWEIVAPHASYFEVIVLSVGQLIGLAELHGLPPPQLGGTGVDGGDVAHLHTTAFIPAAYRLGVALVHFIAQIASVRSILGFPFPPELCRANRSCLNAV